MKIDNELTRLLMDAPQGEWICDQTGMIVSADQGMADILGVPIADMIGKNVRYYVHPSDLGRARSQFDHLLKQRVIQVWRRLSNANGEAVNTVITAYVTADEMIHGVIKAIVGDELVKMAEITYEGLLESSLMGRNQELLEMNQELREISYAMGHELIAPLRSMSGHIGILMEDFGGQLPEAGKQELRTVQASCRHLALLIDELGDLVSLIGVPIQSSLVDAGSVAERAWRKLEPEWVGRKIEFNQEPVPALFSDEAALETVLSALFSNAIKFTEGCQTEEITFGFDPLSRTYFVADTGIGFEPEFAEKVFELFQKLEPEKYPGFGVGLSVARILIRKMGGSIWARCRPGGGTLISFRLPGGETSNQTRESEPESAEN